MYITEDLVKQAIGINKGLLSNVTMEVVREFNILDEREFFNKYFVSKELYLKRFIRYGDPYMRAPLARIGKILLKFNH